MSRIPVKYPYNISISLYGDRFATEDWKRLFMDLAERWQQRFGVQYAWFSCGYHDSPQGKELRHGRRNRKRMEQLLAAKEVRNIVLTAVETEADQARDVECELVLAQPGRSPNTWWPYHHFYFLIVPQVLERVIPPEGPSGFFLSLLRQVDEQLMNVRYGLIQPMTSDKLPALYFANVSSQHLSAEEEQKLYIWKGSNREYQCKVWGAFWGNVWTDEHLGVHREDILARVQAIVGEESVME